MATPCTNNLEYIKRTSTKISCLIFSNFIRFVNYLTSPNPFSFMVSLTSFKMHFQNHSPHTISFIITCFSIYNFLYMESPSTCSKKVSIIWYQEQKLLLWIMGFIHGSSRSTFETFDLYPCYLYLLICLVVCSMIYMSHVFVNLVKHNFSSWVIHLCVVGFHFVCFNMCICFLVFNKCSFLFWVLSWILWSCCFVLSHVSPNCHHFLV